MILRAHLVPLGAGGVELPPARLLALTGRPNEGGECGATGPGGATLVTAAHGVPLARPTSQGLCWGRPALGVAGVAATRPSADTHPCLFVFL